MFAQRACTETKQRHYSSCPQGGLQCRNRMCCVMSPKMTLLLITPWWMELDFDTQGAREPISTIVIKSDQESVFPVC